MGVLFWHHYPTVLKTLGHIGKARLLKAPVADVTSAKAVRAYLAKRGAAYYFRRAIPVGLRPAFCGRAKSMLSLRSSDRAEATQHIPAHNAETGKLLAEATRSLAGKPAPKPGGLSRLLGSSGAGTAGSRRDSRLMPQMPCP